jgi:predicted ATPase
MCWRCTHFLCKSCSAPDPSPRSLCLLHLIDTLVTLTLQFHYDLGKALLSVCEGIDVGDTILVIASQINHGKESIQKNDELCISMAELNMAAGKKAIESCRHKMAYSYLENALSLLPDDHWSSNYDLSLRVSFMMASAANSSSMYEEAENLLQQIFERARSMADKLPSYHLLVTSECIRSFLDFDMMTYICIVLILFLCCHLCAVFFSQGKVVDAYNTCSSMLSHLGETIPENVTPQAVEAIVPETLNKIEKGYNEEWIGKKIENASIRQILKFYTALISASYLFKEPHVMAYFVCRTVQLSLKYGVSKYTPLAFLQLSNIVMNFENAAFI